MSDGFGLGDGVNDLSGTSGLADAKVTDARRGGAPAGTPGWPSTGTMFRVLALLVVAAVIAGWALTVLNAS